MSGRDAYLYERVSRAANRFYNDGLEMARSGDLSGAKTRLTKAVMYNKKNIQARNLLGLVCFQVGEIGEAVRHWKISICFDPGIGNRAGLYLQELKRNSKLAETMNDSLRLYNEAIGQLTKDSPDYALVRLKKAVAMNRNFVKAHLLLALGYVETHNFRKAKAALEKVHKLDPFNPLISRYQSIINELISAGHEDAEQYEVQDLTKDLYAQKTLAQPDVQEIFTGKRAKKRSMRSWSGPIAQMLLFLAGIGCGVAAMFTLYVPDKIDSLNNQITKLSAELTETTTARQTLESQLAQAQQEAHKAQQEKTELELQLEETNDEWQGKLNQQRQNPLSSAMTAFLNADYEACGRALSSIDPLSLKEEDSALYTLLKDKVREPLYTSAFNTGYNAYKAAQQLSGDGKVEKLSEAQELLKLAADYAEEGGSQQTDALYFLARTYYLQENWAEAVTTFTRYFEVYTGSQTAKQYTDAKRFSEQAASKSQQ